MAYGKSERSRFLSGICAILLMAVLLVSIESSADTLIPIPAFNGTFSSSSLTRGYWFEAPTDFEIVGLRVPDESGHGIQNVEVVRFNSHTPPPTFSSTTNDFVSLGRFVNQPSGNILPVSIPVLAGDVIGVLGAAGTSSTMRNSYGIGDFISEIDGHPMTLTRMGMQYNLFSNTARNLWQEPGGFIGRVELWYSTECEPPDAPRNPDPPDGASEVPVDTELEWNIVIPIPCDLANGGFESGGFAPWTTITGPGEELVPWSVTNGGTGWFNNGFPAEGAFFAQNGFDGDAGLFYDIYQEITIPASASSAILNWRERIQWELAGYGASLPREYAVTLQPAGGGSPLAVLYSMNLNPGTNGDTGYVSHSIDLLNAAPGIAGQTVRINFHEVIPETYTGPAQFDLDVVSLVCDGSVLSTPVSPPVNTIDFSALADQYNLLRQEAIARQNSTTSVRIVLERVTAGVRIGDESNTVKDESAPAAGAIAGALNIGGPDCGGYTFIDSGEPGGPSFDWIEISGNGTNLNLGDDTWYYPINLPFSFDFYGSLHNQVAVGSNGSVYFENQYLGFNNECIPNSNGYGVHRYIALYWDDLRPESNENVYYKIVGSAPNRILVVQWEDVRHYGSLSSRVTAQAQLFESSNDILLLYEDPSSEAGAGGTVGIQRDSGCGLQYSCNQQNLYSGLAILFTRGDVPCSSTTTYDVYFGTDPGSMELIYDDICETSCDPTPDAGLLEQPCVTYYWQVIEENRCGTTEGDIWSFTTEGVCSQPPDCSGAFPSVSLLWPPNHQLMDIEIDGVTDPDGDPVLITITGITQDEAIQANASGRTSPDGTGIGTSLARVRSERSGDGNGRVYRISFDASDGNEGGTCSGSVEVCVAHDARISDGGEGTLCIDDGQLYDSTISELLRRADLNNDGIVNQLDLVILTNYWLASY